MPRSATICTPAKHAACNGELTYSQIRCFSVENLHYIYELCALIIPEAHYFYTKLDYRPKDTGRYWAYTVTFGAKNRYLFRQRSGHNMYLPIGSV